MSLMKRKKGVSTQWVSHIREQEDRDSFKQRLVAASDVLSILRKIAKDKLKEREVFKEIDYKDSSWAYACADRNGYNRALNEIIKLIEGIDQDHD